MNLTQDQIQYILDESVEVITEELLQLLIENRIEYIKNAVKDKVSTAHDPANEKMSSDKIVDYIGGKIDPTPRKTHTEWLVNRYKAGDFKLGEGKEVKKTMKAYEEAMPYMENKDLKSYKSLQHLRDNIAPTRMRMKLLNKESTPVAGTNDAGSEKIFEAGGVQGFKLKNKTTSVRNYGPNGHVANTTWCTASEGTHNQFEGYKGGKYPMHFPNGRVLQIHHQTGQLKDETNSQIDINNNPGYSPYKKEIVDFIKQTGELEGQKPTEGLLKTHVPMKPEHVEQLYNAHKDLVDAVDPSKGMSWDHGRKIKYAFQELMPALRLASVSDDLLEKLKSVKTKESYGDDLRHEDMTESVIQSPHITPKQVDTIVDHHIAKPQPDIDTLSTAAQHHAISSETLHKLVGVSMVHPSQVLRNALLYKSPNMTPDHFARMNPTGSEKENAIINGVSSHLPEQYFHELKQTSPQLIASLEKTPPHILKELADNPESAPGVKDNLLNHKSLPKESMQKLVSEATPDAPRTIKMNNLVERTDLEPHERSAIVDKYLEGSIKNDSSHWSNSNKLSREDLSKIIASPLLKSNVSVYGQGVIDNPKIRHKEIESIINHPAITADLSPKFIGSPVIRPSTVDALIKRFPSDSNVHLAILNSKSPAIEGRHITHVIENAPLRTTKIEALEHPANQFSHFEKFKNDRRYHGAISASENAPPSILHELSSSTMEHVRKNVANNPNTEKRTLDILKTDQNPDIAAIATKKAK